MESFLRKLVVQSLFVHTGSVIWGSYYIDPSLESTAIDIESAVGLRCLKRKRGFLSGRYAPFLFFFPALK